MKDNKKLHFTPSDVQTLRSLCDELDRLQKQLEDELVRHVAWTVHWILQHTNCAADRTACFTQQPSMKWLSDYYNESVTMNGEFTQLNSFLSKYSVRVFCRKIFICMRFAIFPQKPKLPDRVRDCIQALEFEELTNSTINRVRTKM